MKTVLIFFLLLFSASPSWADCDLNAPVLGAVYKVITETGQINQPGVEPEMSIETFILWRRNQEVIHEHRDRAISEIWNLVSNGSVRLVRAFDADRRSIEYQPMEVSGYDPLASWDGKYHLVSAQLIERMQLVESSSEGCDLLEQYAFEEGAQSIQLSWLPELELVADYNEIRLDRTYHIILEDIISDVEQVNSAFALRETYKSTDFADIGDNESDPFFVKMMTLGFIQHGASGFYDADGNPLESGGHHH